MYFKKPDKEKGFFEIDGIKFTITRRNVKYFRVEFSGLAPIIVLPPWGNVGRILEENIGRIRKKYTKYIELLDRSEELEFSDRDSGSFMKLVSGYIDTFSKELGVSIRELKFRKMKRMWGNCRSNGVITLNSRLKRLPGAIISYIVYHELLHLLIKGGHNYKFKRAVSEKFPDQKKIEKDLRAFFIKLEGEENKQS